MEVLLGGQAVRKALSRAGRPGGREPEIRAVRPLLDIQTKWSHVPNEKELLVEILRGREGYHVFFYPFEGHLLHEGLSALLAYRLSRLMPMTLTLSANDYGFELLSDREFILDEERVRFLCSADDLVQDILRSVNASEMAKRQFRDIARIAGLVFQGYPGRRKPTRQVQVSTSLLFNVFQRYDPEQFLLKQATREVLDRHLEVCRMEQTLRRMASCAIRIMDTPHPTPMAFPIMVNRLRARVSSETLKERIRRMALRLEKKAKREHP
jgi:ATP-dependent helicase Lhr and Lhr-like helicase